MCLKDGAGNSSDKQCIMLLMLPCFLVAFIGNGHYELFGRSAHLSLMIRTLPKSSLPSFSPLPLNTCAWPVSAHSRVRLGFLQCKQEGMSFGLLGAVHHWSTMTLAPEVVSKLPQLKGAVPALEESNVNVSFRKKKKKGFQYKIGKFHLL